MTSANTMLDISNSNPDGPRFTFTVNGGIADLCQYAGESHLKNICGPQIGPWDPTTIDFAKCPSQTTTGVGKPPSIATSNCPASIVSTSILNYCRQLISCLKNFSTVAFRLHQWRYWFWSRYGLRFSSSQASGFTQRSSERLHTAQLGINMELPEHRYIPIVSHWVTIITQPSSRQDRKVG